MAGIVHVIDNPGLSPDGFERFCELYLDVIIELTPVDTGFCATQWSYVIDPSYEFVTFYNDAPYAEYLERGWSKQAPNGMTGPADAQIPYLVLQSGP